MIEFACSCGQVMKVADEMAGRKGKCPKCGTMLSVPAAPAEEVPVLDAAVPEGPTTQDRRPRQRLPLAKSAARSARDLTDAGGQP